MTEFTSERLAFGCWQGDEEQRLQAIMLDPRMPAFWRARWQGDGAGRFIRFQQDVHAQSQLCNWALWRRADDVLIGFGGLVPMLETGEIEIGWALGYDDWHKGLATEAALRVIAHAKWLGHDKLVALTQPQNDRSMRLADRIGMTCEGPVEWHGNAGVRYVMSLDGVTPIRP